MPKIADFSLLWIISGVMFLIQTVAYSTGTHPKDDNLREACRKEISGLYLSYYDELVQSNEFVESFAVQIQKLKTEHKKIVGYMDPLKKSLKENSFDISTDEKLSSLQSRKHHIEELLGGATKQHDDYKKKWTLADKNWKEIQAQTSSVFRKITRKAPVSSQGMGYPFDLGFTSTCPKFDWSCPLPQRDARALLEMLPPNKLPEICVSYAKMTEGISTQNIAR